MRTLHNPVGKPMRLMTQAEKISEFQRRIDNVTEAEAATPRGQAYLALVRAQKRRTEG
jgi:hypothetical protein